MLNKTNPLISYFEKNDKKLIHKWMHYFDIYHSHFSKYRNRRITVLEFGVSHGGSLQMWKKYFGKKAKIIGVDILPDCKKLEEKNVEIFIGDQEDRKFLKRLMRTIGEVDIVIEDGGHTMKQQINTFEEVFPFVKYGGIYLAEDLHTSYWDEYGGGLKKRGTFIEYIKDRIDDIGAWHSREKKFGPNYYTENMNAIHIYDSVVVFEKSKISPPFEKKTGQLTINRGENKKTDEKYLELREAYLKLKKKHDHLLEIKKKNDRRLRLRTKIHKKYISPLKKHVKKP